MKMTILQRPLVFFFQHSIIAKQWDGLSAYGTLTGKGLRYLYLQRFRNFLNLHPVLDLDLEFILKIWQMSDYLLLFIFLLSISVKQYGQIKKHIKKVKGKYDEN